MDARDQAIEAIRKNTVEGPVRARAISAVGQIDTTGKPFKLFLDGTRRQGDAVLKVLREAEVIETVTAAKPGVKATHRVTEAFVQAAVASDAEPEQKTHDGGARILESISGYAPTRISYDEFYAMLPAMEAKWETSNSSKVETLKDRAAAAKIELEGKLGAAVDTVLWTVVLFDGGVTLEDFSLEGQGFEYSDRTLKSALALLRDAGIILVEGSGRQVRVYRLAPTGVPTEA